MGNPKGVKKVRSTAPAIASAEILSVGVVVHQAARDDGAILVAEVYRVAGVEGTFHAGDPGREQAGALVDDRVDRALAWPRPCDTRR